MANIVDKTEGIISNPKRAIALGIVVLIVVILFFVFKNSIMDLIQRIKTQNAANNELKEEIAAGGGLSYTDTQYIAFANKLYDSMKGFGTDTDTVKYVFNCMKTKADVLKLIQVFGTRDGETLSQWLKGDSNWFKNITKQVNQILSSKGIDYQF